MKYIVENRQEFEKIADADEFDYLMKEESYDDN